MIFSKSQQQFVVVSELAKSSGKSSAMPKAQVDELFSLLFENLFGNKEPISLNDHQEVRTITPNLQLPNNRMFRLNSTPNSTVLVETDPDFTNEKRWLSSDYMFNALRVEPNQAQKRLGDGLYEQRLVREQINRLTGRQFLGNYTDFDSQYQALMNAGVTFAEKFNLRVGIALSPEQVANLTSDIVWLESESVTLPNGKVEQVLVPKVYALSQKGDITGKGALLSGNQVTHRSGELINSGTIAGRELVQLDSQKVKNTGTISGSAILGNITGDLANLGGTLAADRAILLNVSGNLTHSSTLHTTEVNNNGYQRSETTIGRKGLIHVKGSDGLLHLQSGGNFTVSGADIINDGQGQTYLSAKNQLNLTALRTGFDEKMGGDNHYRNQAIQDVEVSRIAGNGEVILRGGSIYSEGADIDAKARLALIAENDIVLGTATRQTAYEEYHKTKSGSAVAKKTQTSLANKESQTQIGTVLSADNIVLSAGDDVTATAAQIVADNDVTIAAGNNVTVTAGTNHFKDIYKETKKTSGAFTSGGGITFGSKSEKHESETEGWTQSDSRSVVGSLSGNVSIVAGNHAHVVGTDLIAPQENTIAITGKTLKVEAGQDIIESNEKHEFKQSGLTVGVSSSLVDTAMAISGGVKQAKQSKNDKLSALYAMKSAQDLIHSSETVSNTIDTVGNLVNGSITPAADDNAAVNTEPSIKVSVSVGASKSQSSSHTREITHSASELNAGNIKLTTTAGNLDVLGSHLNADKISLSSAKDINLESVQNSYQNRSENSNSGWSAGVFLGMSGNSMGLGVEGSAQVGKGKSNTDTITQSNTYLNAKAVSIESQNDTNLKGAVVNADKLNAEIGGNLTIESRQDTNQYHSEQTQVGVSASVAIYGSGSSASASFSQNKAKANSAQVEEQSGFNVGSDGMNITVAGNTHLKGGRIASEAEAENNYFRTGTLTTENIHNHSEMEIKNTSAGVSTNMAQMGMQAVGTALSALGNVDKNTSSTTHSAIGNNIQLEVKEGNIPIALSRYVANSNEKVTAYTQADIAKHTENQEIANLAGQVGARFVGDLSEKLNWKDGSPQKVILHGVVGLISAELSGGNNVAGAAAGVTSEYLNTKVADYLSEKVKNGELTNEERNAIQQATAAGMGAMIGSLIGGNRQTAAQAGMSALNAEKFNRQLHPEEQKRIDELAHQLAREKGGSVEQWKTKLTLIASAMIDEKENNLVLGGVDTIVKNTVVYNLDNYKEDFAIAYNTLKNEASKNQSLKWRDGSDVILYGEKVNMFQATDKQYQNSDMFGKVNYAKVFSSPNIETNSLFELGKLNGLDNVASTKYSSELLGIIGTSNKNRQDNHRVLENDYYRYVTYPKGIAEPIAPELSLIGGGAGAVAKAGKAIEKSSIFAKDASNKIGVFASKYPKTTEGIVVGSVSTGYDLYNGDATPEKSMMNYVLGWGLAGKSWDKQLSVNAIYKGVTSVNENKSDKEVLFEQVSTAVGTTAGGIFEFASDRIGNKGMSKQIISSVISNSLEKKIEELPKEKQEKGDKK